MIRKTQPTTVLVMNDHPKFELCEQIHAASPNTIIVHRMYIPKDANSGWEGTIWRIEYQDEKGETHYRTAQEIVDHVVGNSPDYIVHNFGNEPGVTFKENPKDFTDMVDFFIAAMDYATSINRKLCIWNVQSVIFNLSEIFKDDKTKEGDYDRLLRRLARGDHFLGVHEYTFGLLPIDSSGLSFNSVLLSPKPLKTDWWASPERFQTKAVEHSHLGRHAFIDARCRDLGINVPLKIITEFGWDKVIEQSTDVARYINDEARSSGYQLALGSPTLRRTWERLYPSYSFDEIEAQQCIWADKCYHPSVIGLCIFNWGFNTEWIPFNVATHTEFRNLLVEYAQGKVIEEPNLPKARTIATKGLNWRRFPTSASRLQSVPLPFGSLLGILDVDYEDKIGKNGEWLWVRQGDNIGFVAAWLVEKV